MSKVNQVVFVCSCRFEVTLQCNVAWSAAVVGAVDFAFKLYHHNTKFKSNIQILCSYISFWHTRDLVYWFLMNKEC